MPITFREKWLKCFSGATIYRRDCLGKWDGTEAIPPRTDTIPDLTFSFLAPVYPAILSKNSVFNILASNLDDHGKNHAF